MNWQKYYSRMTYLIEILNNGNTGDADCIAQRLNVSRRTVFRYFEELKLYGADITYSKFGNSYIMKNKINLVEQLNNF